MKINQIILIVSVILFLPLAAISQQLAQNYNLRTDPAFIENKGQITDQNGKLRNDVKYIFAASGFKAAFKDNSFSYEVFTVEKKTLVTKNTSKEIDSLFFKNRITAEKTIHSHRVDISFPGSNPDPEIITEEINSDYNNYYLGHTTEEGATYVHSYKKLIYKNLYNNIDLVLYADKDNSLKYDIVVRPGGKLSEIKMKYKGADGISLKEGKLTIETTQGNIEETVPQSFIQENNQKVKINYSLTGDVIQFTGTYDINKTLVIDPLVLWATYYGGRYDDYGNGVVTDKTGNIYMSGNTTSDNNIATTGSYQSSGGLFYDLFVVKFNSLGKRQWGTYYGGNWNDWECFIAIDNQSNLYLTGTVRSTTGLATTGAYQTINGGNTDGFIAKFSSAGLRNWSTFFGGKDDDQIRNISVDKWANIYITGATYSSNGISTSGAYQTKYNGIVDAYLAKFDSAGKIKFSTYFGGKAADIGYYSFPDSLGNIYFTGQTWSDSNIATNSAYQKSINKNGDAFISKFDSTGNIIWSTYYGDSSEDKGGSLVVDNKGNIYLAGITESSGGIATKGAFREFKSKYNDAFIVKLNSSGNRIWATYFGGNSRDEGNIIILDKLGYLYLAGKTQSDSGISTNGTYQTKYGGGNDIYLEKFDTTGRGLWGTYFGGTKTEGVGGITYYSGNIFMAGSTASNSNITTTNVHQNSFGGYTYDAFLVKFTTDSCIVEKEFTGDTIVCAKTLYSYQTVKRNKYIYKWNLTSGTIIGSNDSNVVTVLWDNDSIGNIKLNTSFKGCPDTLSHTLYVKINPAPEAKVIPNYTICLGSKIAIGDSAVTGNTYLWTSKPVGFTSTQSNPIVSPNVKTTYYLKETVSTTKCAKTDSVIIDINPLPNAKAITNTSICNGDSLLIGFSGISGNKYSWISKPAGFTSTQSNPFVKPTITTKYYLTETIDSTGCSKTDSVLITVNPRPSPKIAGPASGCISTLTNYYVVASSGNKYSWTVKGGQIKSGTGTNSIYVLWTDSSAGEVKIVQSNAYGCSDSFILPVKINSLPIPKTGGNKTVCAGNIYIGDSAVPGYSYYWMDILNNTRPPATANFILNRKTAGTLMYILQVTDSATGCKNNDTVTINLLSIPTPSINDSDDLCGETVAKYFTPYVNGNKYQWQAEGGTIISGANTNEVVILWSNGNLGKLKVVESNINGCKDSVLVNIKLWPVPAANTGQDQSICIGEATSIGSKSVAGHRYVWSSNPAGFHSFDANPNINPVVTTTYYLKETISATGCFKSDSIVITVNPKPNPLIKGDSTICQGIISNYTVMGDSGSSFSWKIAGGNIIGNNSQDSITVQWTTAGIGTISVTESNLFGCNDSSGLITKINPLPVAAFSANDTCLGNRINFKNQSKNTVSYLWYFGNSDTSTLQNPSYLYKNPGSYKVKLVVASGNGCKDSSISSITINPLPAAFINIVQDTTSKRSYTFSSTGNASQYLWSFGDGKIDSGKTVKHTYQKDSTYKISLAVSDSNRCTGVTDTTITVFTVGVNEILARTFNLKLYPNPFSNSTTLEYEVYSRSKVNISIYDITGKEITGLQNGVQADGRYILNIDAEKYQLKAGIYILKVAIGNDLISRQLIKLKE